METPSKPWKVEYAKSSRSSCKTCKNSIVKGNLRIAKMVSARQFEGLMPMWNHAECILKQRGQFRTVDDVEGVDTLRSEDQEKINKYLEDLDDGSVSAIYANTVIDGIAESSIEKSKTSRATCKSCNQKIAKGEVRISTTADPDNPWFHGTLAAWRHAKCFLEMGWWTCAMDKMSGWDSLTAEDKQAVQSIAKPYIQDPKQEAGEPLESPGTSSKTPQASNHENKVGGEGKDKKRKPEESEILSCKNQNRVGSTKAKTRKMDGDMGQGSVEETAELEKNLKKQTKLGGSLAPTNTSGFLKILVADNFGMLPLQNEASEDLEEMEHISLALHDTLKYIKRAKARLDYLEAENEELKATQELVRVKLENEFASVPLMSHHHRELEVLAEDQKPLMEVTYQACQYKRMQELAQECMKKEITVSVVQDSKEQDHKDNLTNFHEPSSMDDVQSKP